MYSRIWNRYPLRSRAISPVAEPFQKLVHQGMILGSNGIKMGKRFPEFVSQPKRCRRESTALIHFRLYEMFMGPLEASKPWSDSRVLKEQEDSSARVWNFFTEPEGNVVEEDVKESSTRIYHQTVKKVTDDFEAAWLQHSYQPDDDIYECCN